jgi:hypothetical protein
MPPVYHYHCDRSGASIDVVRDVDLRDQPPTPEEITAAKLPDPPAGGFAFERKILPPKVSFGNSWSVDGRGLKGRH